MNEPFPEPLAVWRFIRRHFVRIVIGVVLAAATYGAASVFVLYQTTQREQRIGRKIEDLGGVVRFQYCGPSRVPYSRLQFFDRILRVNLGHSMKVPLDVLVELGSLKNLNHLGVGSGWVALFGIARRGSRSIDDTIWLLRGSDVAVYHGERWADGVLHSRTRTTTDVPLLGRSGPSSAGGGEAIE